MTPLKQRRNECTLTSLSVLNGFSQTDYHALSDLCRERGVNWLSHTESALQTRRLAFSVCKDLGMVIPAGYDILDRSNGKLEISPGVAIADFDGKGVVHISWIPYRCRRARGHALAFEDGKFYDTDRMIYDGWAALVEDYEKRLRRRDLRCNSIFKL